MMSLPDNEAPPPSPATCRCVADDPMAAREAIRKGAVIDSLVDESHFMVTLLRCDQCKRVFLKVFTELIDWSGGDDSQAWMYVPIDAVEARKLREAGAAINDQFLLEMKINRRFLSDVYPRGGDRRVTWGTGPLVILPHD